MTREQIIRSTDINDAQTPEDVAAILRNAARACLESQADLSSAWQDDGAGKVWTSIAAILERAAKSVDARCDKGY